MSFLFGIEVADVMLFTTSAEASMPSAFLLVPRNSKEAASRSWCREIVKRLQFFLWAIWGIGKGRGARVFVSLGCSICCMREFWCTEKAKVTANASDRERGLPLATSFVPADTEESRCVVRSRFSDVASVLGARYISEIGNHVPVSRSVLVVDFSAWPSAVHKSPDDSMRHDFVAIETDQEVSVRWRPGSLPWARFPKRDTPDQFADLVEQKELARPIQRRIGFSHDALQKLIGQRPSGAQTPDRLRYFTVA